MNRFVPAAVLCSLLAPAFVAADAEVTLEKIMAHPDWLGRAPENFYWADDSGGFYHERKVEGSEARELFEASLAGEVMRTVADADRGTVDVAGGALSPDRSLKTYSRDGDVFVKDLANGTIRQLTRTAAAETDPFFTADGTAVVFRRDDRFLARRLADGLESLAADVRLEDDPQAEDEDPAFLAAQQERLFDVVRQRKQEHEAELERERARQAADPTRAPLPFYLGDKVEIDTASLSPNGRWLILGTLPAKRDKGTRTPMADWVTDSGDVETSTVRPKVGSGEPVMESLVLLDLERHERHDLDPAALPGIFDDPLADLRQAAVARKAAAQPAAEGAMPPPVDGETGDGDKAAAVPRPFGVLQVVWSGDGERVALMLRSRDNKDRWIATVDFDAPALRALDHERDPAWINYAFYDLGWMADNETLYYLSEATGYSALYTQTVDSEPRLRVGGDFVVAHPQPTRDGSAIYYVANKSHPGIKEIYRLRLADGEDEQITRLGGLNSALVSPDGSRLLVEHSTTTRPPELYVQDAAPGAAARQVTWTTSDEFLAVDWTAPEVVTVPSTHVDRAIYSRLYLPPPGAEAPGDLRPAVLFVHGAGYLQNAHQGWSDYFREFMFHTLLTRRGYVVLDMDYRASAGYGRDWRTAIYRQMGTPELEDLEDGVAWLVAHHGVDPRRVGVYGGSYGGFMTLMALFKDPQLFAAGAALRPVTDWASYNHPYTSDILNTPDLDPEAYARSSPIEFAAGLERPLLICAPMLDDNVLFQDIVRLVQRLIELEKSGFETAVFPVEHHGFRQPSSWLNEYRRIYDLFERWVRPVP
jgi:dipeptidyl aminopeptidase/acylaminoacyl peptidase